MTAPGTTLADPQPADGDWPIGESWPTQDVPPPPEPVGGDPDATPDPEAPYGRKADGTPKAKPGAKPTGGRRPRSRAKRTTPPPPKKTTSGPSKAPPSRKTPDYRKGIVSLLSLPAGLLGAAGAGLGRRELVADAATIMMAAPDLAEGVNELALQDPRIEAVLDRVLAAGPYGALISAMVPLIAQVACNHGMIKAGTLGTHDPEALITAFGGGSGAGPDVPAG